MAGVKTRIPLSTGWADGTGAPVLLGDRAILHSTIDVHFPGADGQPELRMRIECGDGVPRVRHVEVSAVEGGRDVRTSDIRSVELANWVEVIVSAFMHDAEQTDSGVVLTVRHQSEAALRGAVKQLRAAKRADRRKVDDAFLQQVAQTYRSDDLRPAEAVEVKYGVSTRTAYRYISLAREAGHLPPKESNA